MSSHATDPLERRLSAAAFVGLALFSVVPLAKLLSHTLEHGLVFTGADGLFPADQFQYMSWIRQFGDHLLAANLLDLAPSSHVFLHPQFLLSGLAWRAGVGIQMAFLLWKPIAVMALFFGFRSYVARFLPGTGQRVAAFVAAMFFASPIAALVSWASIGSAHFQYQISNLSGELFAAGATWGYLPTAIALGLMPLFALGVERLWRVPEGRPPPRTLRHAPEALDAEAAVSWLHPWQGEVLLLTVLAVAAFDRAVLRQVRFIAPLVALLAPLVYYFVLSHADAAWSFAAHENALGGHVPWWAVTAGVVPLALPACFGLRAVDRSPGELMLRAWPLAALVVYLVLSPSFPQHAFEGVSLPLAVLAVRGLGRMRLAAPIYRALGGEASGYYLRSDETRALDYLASLHAPGGVLSTYDLAPFVPAATGRPTWVGHPSWTRHFPERVRASELLFAGDLRRERAIAFIRSTHARFILVGCGHPAAPFARLAPAVSRTRTFGCASVYEVAPTSAAGPAGGPAAPRTLARL